MDVKVNGLRRKAKNIAKNYTEPQKKVREATSNDPWGPPSTIMSEISDLTYNAEAYNQIMEMLWKRLNDSGKNWRHVYKALILIEYLIKTGSEKVAQQCKENIFAINTLKDFQHYEDNKDQGINVREKAKQLAILLSSEDKLKNERSRALQARERFSHSQTAFGSSPPPFGRNNIETARTVRNPDIDAARPHSPGEEELQLQVALAMSKEEAEQEERQRRNDELRLQMALSQSEQEFQSVAPPQPKKPENSLVDLLDIDLGGTASALPPPIIGFGGVNSDPWGNHNQQKLNANLSMSTDPWANNLNSSVQPQSAIVIGKPDPWGKPSSHPISINKDPWNTNSSSASAAAGSGMAMPIPINDPWAPKVTSGIEDIDGFSNLSSRPIGGMPMGMGMRMNTSPIPYNNNRNQSGNFLGENSALVNLNNLSPNQTSSIFGSSPGVGVTSSNPFGLMNTAATAPIAPPPVQPSNPFHIQNTILKPSINEIRQQQLLQTNNFNTGSGTGQSQPQPAATAAAVKDPWAPVSGFN